MEKRSRWRTLNHEAVYYVHMSLLWKSYDTIGHATTDHAILIAY